MLQANIEVNASMAIRHATVCANMCLIIFVHICCRPDFPRRQAQESSSNNKSTQKSMK